MINKDGLSDAELEEIAKRPQKTKAEIFGKADASLRKNKERLASAHPSAYVLIDAHTFEYIVATSWDDAFRHYKKMHGPLPLQGVSFVGQQF